MQSAIVFGLDGDNHSPTRCLTPPASLQAGPHRASPRPPVHRADPASDSPGPPLHRAPDAATMAPSQATRRVRLGRCHRERVRPAAPSWPRRPVKGQCGQSVATRSVFRGWGDWPSHDRRPKALRCVPRMSLLVPFVCPTDARKEGDISYSVCFGSTTRRHGTRTTSPTFARRNTKIVPSRLVVAG
jgi:hypothetical protein